MTQDSVPATALEKTVPYPVKYSFCTFVTNLNEYQEMRESAASVGFIEDVEFLFLDNSQENQMDAYDGINHFLTCAKGQYVIICHQDILFKFDNRETLDNCIKDLSAKDPRWAILGNAGIGLDYKSNVRMSDPTGDNISRGDFPVKVMSLDENFLVINAQYRLSVASDIGGFHMYGPELCLNAYDMGYSCYAVDFHLLHKSAGKVNDYFFEVLERFKHSRNRRKKTVLYQSMITRFILGGGYIGSMLNRMPYILNIYKSIKRRLSNKSL